MQVVWPAHKRSWERFDHTGHIAVHRRAGLKRGLLRSRLQHLVVPVTGEHEQVKYQKATHSELQSLRSHHAPS